MFKDAIDQMKDDEYIDKLHRQINGLKSDIEMVDQQNLSIMKTAEKFKCKSEKLEQQNKRYRDALIYVLKTHLESYHDPKNMLEDIKSVVNGVLEGTE